MRGRGDRAAGGERVRVRVGAFKYPCLLPHKRYPSHPTRAVATATTAHCGRSIRRAGIAHRCHTAHNGQRATKLSAPPKSPRAQILVPAPSWTIHASVGARSHACVFPISSAAPLVPNALP